MGSIQYSPAAEPGGADERGQGPTTPLHAQEGTGASPSGRCGWLRCSSWHTRPGRSAVPGGRRSCSTSMLSDFSEASTSSRPPSGAPRTERRRRRSPCSSAGGPWRGGEGEKGRGEAGQVDRRTEEQRKKGKERSGEGGGDRQRDGGGRGEMGGRAKPRGTGPRGSPRNVGTHQPPQDPPGASAELPAPPASLSTQLSSGGPQAQSLPSPQVWGTALAPWGTHRGAWGTWRSSISTRTK